MTLRRTRYAPFLIELIYENLPRPYDHLRGISRY